VQQAWNLTYDQLSSMFETLEEQMNGYLFGGAVVTRKISDVALKYNNTVTEKWNMDMLANND